MKDLTNLVPRYYQIYLSLRERITSGKLQPGDMIPTERELGEEFGTSRITVIKALNMLVSEGMIGRQQGRGSFILNYLQKKEEKQAITKTVAFVCGFLSHPFQASILVGISNILAKHGISLQVFGYAESDSSEQESIKLALNRGVNGFIILPRPDYHNEGLYQKILEDGISMVMVDRYCIDLNSDYVIYDGRTGGYDLTTLLIKRGHKRIAFAISDEVLPTSVMERLSGYRDALIQHSFTFR